MPGPIVCGPIVCAQKDTTWSQLATASRSRSCRLMLQLGYILLAVTACSLLLNDSGYNPRAATPQDLNTETFGGKSMDPFVKVMVCAPINVKVVPGPEHKLAITADASVERALSVNVDEGISTAAAVPAHGQSRSGKQAHGPAPQEPCPSRPHEVSVQTTPSKSL